METNRQDIRQKAKFLCSELESCVQIPRLRARVWYTLHPDGTLPRSLSDLQTPLRSEYLLPTSSQVTGWNLDTQRR